MATDFLGPKLHSHPVDRSFLFFHPFNSSFGTSAGFRQIFFTTVKCMSNIDMGCIGVNKLRSILDFIVNI